MVDNIHKALRCSWSTLTPLDDTWQWLPTWLPRGGGFIISEFQERKQPPLGRWWRVWRDRCCFNRQNVCLGCLFPFLCMRACWFSSKMHVSSWFWRRRDSFAKWVRTIARVSKWPPETYSVKEIILAHVWFFRYYWPGKMIAYTVNYTCTIVKQAHRSLKRRKHIYIIISAEWQQFCNHSKSTTWLKLMTTIH